MQHSKHATLSLLAIPSLVWTIQAPCRHTFLDVQSGVRLARLMMPRLRLCALHAQYFIDLWAQLVSDVLTAAPEAKGKILLDLINEPDGYGFTW